MQGPAFPGVPQPAHPANVSPGLTQYPTPGVAGYPPSPWATSPSLGYPMGQASAAPPPQQAQPFMRVPGPSALGAPPLNPLGAVGNAGGVSLAPVSGVGAPPASGGPHPLPSMPQVPLPQGFPNPFAVQGVPQQTQAQAPVPPQQQPGTTTVTGPQGYMPGLGYFGTPPTPPATALPALPATGAATFHPHGQGFAGSPPMPQAMPQQVPQGPRQGTPQGEAQNSPFWFQLAWQLVQTPAVREALGDRHQALVEGDERLRTLHAATSCLSSPDLQAAFKALTSGQMQQQRFTELFAGALRAVVSR